MDHDFIGEIVSKVIDAQVNPAEWHTVCDLAERRFDATGFMLFQFDPDARNTPQFCGSTRTTAKASHLIDVMSRGEDDEDHEAYTRIGDFPRGEIISEYQIYGVKHDLDLRPNANRDAVLAALGSNSRNIARLNDVGPWMDIAAIHMPCFGRDIPAPVKTELNFLFPIIGKAIEAGRIISRLAGHANPILEIFDRLRFAAAVCRPNLKVLFYNHLFRELVQDRDGLSMVGNQLLADKSDAQLHLSRVIRSGCDPCASARENIIALPRRSGKKPYIVRSMPMSDPLVAAPVEPLCLMLILDPDGPTRIDVDGIAALDLLTETELNVCASVVLGMATEVIAENRGTSLVTVRNQIKSLMGKLSCSSRLDVVRIAMSTTTPLDQPNNRLTIPKYDQDN